VAELPIDLGPGLAERLARVLDVEGKIPRALEALGPIGGRDVLLLGGADGIRARQLTELGGRVAVTPEVDGPAHFDAPDDSADVVVGAWTSFRGGDRAAIAEATRVGRPGARLLVLHDYGRDDVSRLMGDRPEYNEWSRRDGPFLGHAFRVRVIHCFWTFESLEDAGDFLTTAFAQTGPAVAESMKRPRLSYNVAVYHRTLGAPV
jgi:hypothetical protein